MISAAKAIRTSQTKLRCNTNLESCGNHNTSLPEGARIPPTHSRLPECRTLSEDRSLAYDKLCEWHKDVYINSIYQLGRQVSVHPQVDGSIEEPGLKG
jgi:hypothetical protein